MAAFSNQAFLTYSGQSVASNLVTGQVVSPLTLTKTALSGTYSPGGDLTYVVTIVNAGATAFENLTLTDDLGAYPAGQGTLVPLAYVEGTAAWFINGTRQPDPAMNPRAPLVISGLSVPVGGNVVVLYEASVTEAAPPTAGSEIVNTVTLSGNGISAPLEARASVTVENAPILAIDKALSPASVEPGGQLTYTFTIRNSGNADADASTDVAVSDLFDPALTGLTVTLDGSTLSTGTDYAYDEATGQFDTVPGRITVPAAVFAQAADTGRWQITPGEAVLVVRGTVG